MSQEWSKDDALETYALKSWGLGFFDINDDGKLVVNSECGKSQIEIEKVIEEMKSQGIQLPAVIRFHDILRSRVKTINETFKNVIEDAEYQGRYFGVYPVKVNQMREVVEEIVDAGEPFDFGLEAGSKPEILTAMAYNTNPNSLTILNGYKDKDFLRLALMAKVMEKNAIVVIEKYSELETLLQISKEMNVKPTIGIRSRLSIAGKGRWANSSGERAKFGLSIPEIVRVVKRMEEEGLKDCIKLLHFHIGSQISDIKTIKNAITEGARIFVALAEMGCELEYFDAGGGLGVDYDGSRSDSDSSVNYSLTEYISDIVWELKQICDLKGVKHPNIVTESGRAITAHHSCVVTNVVDQISTANTSFMMPASKKEHIIIQNLRVLDEDELTDDKSLQVFYNEALQLKSEYLSAFNLGVISIEERAIAESLYWRVLEKIKAKMGELEKVPDYLYELNQYLSPQYLCNFSVFQSAADSWAVDQLLPVMPLSKLNEKPEVHCSIADITCDSDGKINKFLSPEGVQQTVPLHKLNKGEDYHIGLFMTGAYQDVMGDMHNLFGRLHEVHVYSDPTDPVGFYIEEVIKGNTSETVLATMQYNPDYMAKKVKKKMTRKISEGKINPREGVKLVDFYEDCLKSYTYLS